MCQKSPFSGALLNCKLQVHYLHLLALYFLGGLRQGRNKWVIRGFIAPEVPQLDLITDAEYVVNLINVNVVVSVQQCSLLHAYATPA